MMYSLPNDAITRGYRKTSAYKFEQVFFSPSVNFTGTELEFIRAGHGYKYIQIDPYTRIKVPA